MAKTPATLRGQDTGLERYMAQVRQHPILSREQEQELASRYFEQQDVEAAHALTVSNLRFVVKVAHEFRGYGLKLLDLVQEGNLGLMVAVKKFDPRRGFRLITYAVWWIRAFMQSFILRSWSLVRMGTSRLQRKLFFRLRGEQARARRVLQQDDLDAINAAVAERLGVAADDVRDLSARLLGHDQSLDSKINDDESTSHLDLLMGDAEDADVQLSRHQADLQVRRAVDDVRGSLNDKEQAIVARRLLADEPESLQTIGQVFSISRERVRQLETRVKHKLRAAIESRQTTVENQ